MKKPELRDRLYVRLLQLCASGRTHARLSTLTVWECAPESRWRRLGSHRRHHKAVRGHVHLLLQGFAREGLMYTRRHPEPDVLTHSEDKRFYFRISAEEARQRLRSLGITDSLEVERGSIYWTKSLGSDTRNRRLKLDAPAPDTFLWKA